MVNNKEHALQGILKRMHLRRPQEEAMKRFHAVMNGADTPLSEMTAEDVAKLFRSSYPGWHYSDSAVEFTFHLATGVGKTRLIGALMAYLFLSGEARNFVIISPRAEIIRKFHEVCHAASDDYIFVDPNFVDVPRVMDGESQGHDNSFLDETFMGPRLWILTPQSFTAKEARIKKREEFSPRSTAEYLQSLDDLVVFFDESHHLGYDSKSDSIWRKEIRALEPKMIIGTTASVDDFSNTNVIYSYDLRTCMNEKLFTKLVQIIPDKKDSTINDDDYDAVILRYGWNQLLYKQKVLDDYERANGISKRVKAVMLVACQDIAHAEQVAEWFVRFLGNKDAVLLVHSRMKDSEFLPGLHNIENPDSPVRVVVNVSKLTEGWDVSNIYVIAPLRAMASSTLVTQIMGRGLRLPYRVQTGNEEVDTLDVLCFGKETMQEICDKLLQQGYGVGSGGIRVALPPADSGLRQKEFVPTKKYPLQVVSGPGELAVPLFKLSRPLLDLSQVSIPALRADVLHAFFISDPRTIRSLNGALVFDCMAFLKTVTSEVIRQCPYLSYARHYHSVFHMVKRFLSACGYGDQPVPLEPEKVVAHIKASLDVLSRQAPARYVSMDIEQKIDLTHQEIHVPETLAYALDVASFHVGSWSARTHRGIPFKGWARSAFEAVPFDQVNELKIAKIIDRSAEVKRWFRNLPGMITLQTPAGRYSPDFAVFLKEDAKNILLEIKGDIYYGKEDADATIKANAAREWCRAQSAASGQIWEYWFLLDSDADICDTFDDIRENADVSSEN